MELQEVTPDPASKLSKSLFEPGTEVLTKSLGSGANLSRPSGKALARLFFLLLQLSRYQELILECTTFELKSGTLTKTK